MKITQEEFHRRFPGFDYGLICTKEHPQGDAPGSMAHLVSIGAISIDEEGLVTVHDSDRCKNRGAACSA
jgi:hypothetical protein